MTFDSTTMVTVKKELRDALNNLINANSQSNSKGNLIKAWFVQNFSEIGKVGLVNEAKQAGNRIKEQLTKRDAQHAIFVITEDKTLAPLAKALTEIAYTGLKTAIIFKSSNNKFVPVAFYEIEPSKVGDFYRAAFPNVYPIILTPMDAPTANPTPTLPFHASPFAIVEKSNIESSDPILLKVRQLISDGFAGVVFSGPPGTSKSWYAREVALSLVDGGIGKVDFVQFHPGYQYEDFIQGYVPNAVGGFESVDRTFLRMCNVAENTDGLVVIVIDELSRTDVVRVFGEALTYIEMSKRNIFFTLASGKKVKIPRNLIIIATMNPWDRGVDELDLALERRLAKIPFDPSVETLRNFMANSMLDEEHRKRLELFFYRVSRHANPLCRIGHAYFSNIDSLDSLHRRWNNQLVFHFERVLRDSPDDLKDIKASWGGIFVK